jgi:cytochrome b561
LIISTPSSKLTREIATPATIVFFVVSTITGIVLMLHWKAGWVREAHEWLSLLFSAIVIWHLIRNWAGFKHYIKRRPAQFTFIICILISLVFTGLTGHESGEGRKRSRADLAPAPFSIADFGLVGVSQDQ